MARSILHAVAVAVTVAVSCSPVGAAVVNSYTNHFDIEFYDNVPDVWLKSEVLLNAGFASLRYTVSYDLVDVGLDVAWYDHNNAVLVRGGGGYASGHYVYSTDVDYVGFLAPVIAYGLFGGKADFSAGQVQKFPCFSKVCPTSHYDWLHNSTTPPPGPGPGPGNRLAPTQTVVANPTAIEGVDQTRATFSVHVPSVDDPDNRNADTVVDLYRLTSTVQALGTGWQYRYTVSNLTDSEVAVELDALQLSGVLGPAASRESFVDASGAPGILRTAAVVSRTDGPFGTMRFDALAPVPEVPSLWAWAAGLSGLAWRLRRRIAVRQL